MMVVDISLWKLLFKPNHNFKAIGIRYVRNMKYSVLNKRNDIFYKVKDYINYYLNPSKVNFYDSSKQILKEILEKGANYYEQMKTMAHS